MFEAQLVCTFLVFGVSVFTYITFLVQLASSMEYS